MNIGHDSLFFAALRYRRHFVHDDSRQKLAPLDIPNPEARCFDPAESSMIPAVVNLPAETGQLRYVAL